MEAAPLASRDQDGEPVAPVRKATQIAMAELLLRLLGRTPGPREMDVWIERMRRSESSEQFIEMLMKAPPVSGRKSVHLDYPPGHYFSPVVDTDLVRGYVDENRRAGTEKAIAGISFPLQEMDAFWARQREVIAATPFPDRKTADYRYSFLDGPYGYGDGVTLRAMIADKRPKRIIEIGSGYSTACMLDTIDELALDTQVTCIEPYPGHLFSIMRPADKARVTLIAEGVQGQPLEQFAALEPKDILFIDSTHVLKTGSDVHYELFYILPVLRPGVIIHIHDCRFPFEYPDQHIFKRNRSWNEAYGVRALLANSTRFRPLFSGSFFAVHREELIGQTFPRYLTNSGSALWLEVLDDGGPYGLDAVASLPGFSAKTIFRPDKAAEPSAPPAKSVVAQDASQPRKEQMEVRVGDTIVPFSVVRNGTGPIYFSLGVRKSGSTMLHRIVAALAAHNNVNVVDFPDTFFRRGLLERNWVRLDLQSLLQSGNLYNGFRSFPRTLAESPSYRTSLKIFMHRDPRDAIVSQYFSDAYSHSLPEASDQEGRERFLDKRLLAQSTEIDEWVLQNAPSLAQTIEMFESTLADKNCLILPYEKYVFEKQQLLRDIMDHFGWSITEKKAAAILERIGVIPQQEDQQRFIRKATPGDHRVKLKPDTITEINKIFAKGMQLFGYA